MDLVYRKPAAHPRTAWSCTVTLILAVWENVFRGNVIREVSNALPEEIDLLVYASRWTTTSISAVCGNMSSGVIELIANLCWNSFRSRASVGGVHDT